MACNLNLLVNYNLHISLIYLYYNLHILVLVTAHHAVLTFHSNPINLIN